MKPSFKNVFLTALKAGTIAAFANVILFFLFSAIGVISDSIVIPQSNTPLTVGPVILSSFIPSLLAGVVFYLLVRYTRNGYKYFFIASVLLLLLSFANPFMGIPDITVAMGVALNVMHVVVVVSLLYFFRQETNAVRLKTL